MILKFQDCIAYRMVITLNRNKEVKEGPSLARETVCWILYVLSEIFYPRGQQGYSKAGSRGWVAIENFCRLGDNS